MGNIIDLTGQKFGRWTVLRFCGLKRRESQWECKCECGNVHVVGRGNLVSGRSQSCGCLREERLSAAISKHNMSEDPLFFAWHTMKARCYSAKNHSFKNYGARGIGVCEKWKNSFKDFYDYVSKLPHYKEKGYTLDRIDVNGNYEPGNVRWATASQQAANTRRNVFFEKDGIIYSPRSFSDKYGIPYEKVYHEFITKPKIKAKRKEK